MDELHSTTLQHKKGKHLSYEERIFIQIRLKDGWSANKIAKELGCAPNTVRNEIKRGSIDFYHGKVHRYKAEAGQKAYEANRINSCRHYDLLKVERFISYVNEHFFKEGWSLDACHGRALLDGGFSPEETVCTKTLYNYVDMSLLDIRNINLPLKLKRSTKPKRIRENKRIFGRSIVERPSYIDDREEFGHWEADLVVGSKKADDPVLLTLAERKSREFFAIKIKDKTPESVIAAINSCMEMYSEHVSEVFKTITTDNGLEFSSLGSLEKISKTLIYYAHPYAAYEKGTIERHNSLIRRFIPKGHRIDEYSPEEISAIEEWCNGLPRKILGYRTPDEVFDEELDRIYAV